MFTKLRIYSYEFVRASSMLGYERPALYVIQTVLIGDQEHHYQLISKLSKLKQLFWPKFVLPIWFFSHSEEISHSKIDL